MPETFRQLGFPAAEQEFSELGVNAIRLEVEPDKYETVPLQNFCEQLPTAPRIAKSYGLFRTAGLIARQLQYLNPEMQGKLGFGACYLAGINYCLGSDERYNLPLPYSIGMVLVAQLAYGVKRKLNLPPGNKLAPVTDINAQKFTQISKEGVYRDPNIYEVEKKRVLRSGLITLVGANLLYQPIDPYSTDFVLRDRSHRVTETSVVNKLTIPGGRAMSPGMLEIALSPIADKLNLGKDGQGHTLFDVTGLREANEETHLPVENLSTARPLTRADQIMRKSSGEVIRYIAYIWQTIIWDDAIHQLEDGDGMGGWEVYGPGRREDFSRRTMLSELDLTPIAQIALKAHRG